MNRARDATSLPDMSTDNTDEATLGTSGTANQIINQIDPGMRVVDVNGEELGKIDHVKMGSPDAATVDRAGQDRPGLIDAFLGQEEPDLPEPMRSRLLRIGYAKIDGKGWIDIDRYVTAGHIGRISGDTVTLTLDKDQVLREL